MHEEPNHLVNHFYEKILGLKELSDQRRNLPEEHHVSKNIGYLNEFLLAYGGQRHNLYHQNVTRMKASRVAHSILSSQNKTVSNSLPMECISSNYQEKLLEASLRFEEDLFPEWFQSKEGKENHIQKFAKAVERQKFCSLDVENAITSRVALDIFSHLNETMNATQKFEEEMKFVHVGDLVRYESLTEEGLMEPRVGEVIKIEVTNDQHLFTLKFTDNREIKVINPNTDDLSKLSIIGFSQEDMDNLPGHLKM